MDNAKCNALKEELAAQAFLPQFIGPTEPVIMKSLLLAGIHYVEGILWLVGLSILLDHTRRFLLKPSVRRWLEGRCGTVLMGFGARLVLERQSLTRRLHGGAGRWERNCR